jgi:hypothetical protein
MEDREIIVTLLRQIMAKQEQSDARLESMDSRLTGIESEVRGLKERQQQTEEMILARLNDTRPLGVQPEILQRLDRIDRKLALLEKALGEMAGRDLELRSRVILLETQIEQPKTQ